MDKRITQLKVYEGIFQILLLRKCSTNGISMTKSLIIIIIDDINIDIAMNILLRSKSVNYYTLKVIY